MDKLSTNPTSSSTQQQSLPPMYQSLANVNVSNFVSLKLSGNKKSNNYSSWKRQMLGLIEGHDLIGFIDGSVPVKDLKITAMEVGSWNQKDYDVWRTDKVLRGWILGSISESRLLEIVSDSATARAAWLVLERRFDEKDDVEKDYFENQIPELEPALGGDWAAAQILESGPGAPSTWIDNPNILTSLEAAVGTRKNTHDIKTFLARIPADDNIDLLLRSLRIAAAVGNIAAAALFVNKMPSLYYIADDSGDFPIQYAARCAQRNTLEYMINVTKDDEYSNPYQGLPGLRLLTYAIDAEFFDIALWLMEKYPDLVRVECADNDAPLVHIVTSPVLSKTRFNLNEEFWNLLGEILKRCPCPVPRGIKTKRMDKKDQALELLGNICVQLKSWDNFREAQRISENAILKAAELDIPEVVEIIMDKFPVYAFQRPFLQRILQVVAENHSEGVLNPIHPKIGDMHLFFDLKDSDGNNLLHLAGSLAPVHKLNQMSISILRMQRELMWFEEVQMLAGLKAREEKNLSRKTPQEMFTDEHKVLKEAGEKWIRETASACTTSAALITTVMFAASITVPGGNNQDTGYPMFIQNKAFAVFLAADSVSLFTSVLSLLLFLQILTSRYATQDFLEELPRSPVLGLGALHLSLSSMMISFGATLYLVSRLQSLAVLLVMILLPVYVINVFGVSLVSLMIELVYQMVSTRKFRENRNRPFY